MNEVYKDLEVGRKSAHDLMLEARIEALEMAKFEIDKLIEVYKGMLGDE